nr:alpha/beta hydrolase [Mammaliicoccus sp. Marseille-Q6498]
MNKHLYIAHGYNAASDKHWFKWLASQFKDVDSYIFDFPNASNPVLEEWSNTLNNEMDLSQGENIIVAHSLGVVTVLDMLSKYKSELNVKGLVLVAGFDETIPDLDKIDQYVESTQLNYDKIKENVPNIVMIAGSHDRVVPFSLSNKLAERLNTNIVELEHDGHFCEDDGYVSFPEVAEYVEKIFDK